ncbi:MAG: NAD(P)/FAD-dependent oxidoreductase [Actinomycetes bacterium]
MTGSNGHDSTSTPGPIVIIGAGPAGLTAAYQAVKAGDKVIVLEGQRVVGGISQTAERGGWRFDIGGHRFFTKVQPVEDLWHEILPDEDFLMRPRMSRIFYQGKYYDYPLKAMNALKNLGIFEAVLCVLSYGWAQVRPPKDQSNYENWLVARFGKRLYRTFFETYTEKVWGVPVKEMPADWAAQRVKGLSMGNAIMNALLPKRNQKEITSLIEEFQYPKFGPGMMWERCRDLIVERGGVVEMKTRVEKIHLEGGKAVAVSVVDREGNKRRIEAAQVISTMPMNHLAQAFEPSAPAAVMQAGKDLHYRDFLTIALVVPEDKGFPDNWIYIHSPEVHVGRIQNFGSWSPFLVQEGKTCLGLEYFVFEGDELWNSSDEDLIELGKRELELLNLVDASDVQEGYVVRMPKAYPYYDSTYTQNVDRIRAFLASEASNVYPVGRNGMHKYNNQDHSMYTAMLTIENLHGANHDIWAVNVEEEYHETSSSSSSGGTGRDAPILPKRPA